jgi:hypothetical protein
MRWSVAGADRHRQRVRRTPGCYPASTPTCRPLPRRRGARAADRFATLSQRTLAGRRVAAQRAVLAQIAAGREEQRGAIRRAVTLHHTGDEVQRVLRSDPGEPVDRRSGNGERRLQLASEVLSPIDRGDQWNRTPRTGVIQAVVAQATRALVSAALLYGFGLGAALSGAASPPRHSGSGACPVTIPNRSTPPGEHPSTMAHGNGRLWTILPPNGRMVVSATIPPPPGTYFGQIHPDGSISEKFPWWGARSADSRLTFTGARLDAHARPLRAHIAPGFTGAPHFWATTLTFASSGCWKVTARAGTARLGLVIFVSAGKS